MRRADEAVPYLAMVSSQFAQVGLMVLSKRAMESGMTNFTFIFYSNSLSSLLLLSSFIIHRSSHLPPLTFALLCEFLWLGLLGFLVQMFGITGIQYASASLASSMLNLVPGFVFILAIIFRMERVDWKNSSTVAKATGTATSIVGALIVTLYKGLPLLINTTSHLPQQLLLPQNSNWMIGGLLLAIDSVVASIFVIVQAFILKKYPGELIVMFFYSCTVALLSAAVSLVVDKDHQSAWSLQSNTRLFAVLYAGFFGTAFQVTIGAWCLQRRGPVFVAMFHPLGIVIATVMGVIFLGDAFYLGSLVGSIVIAVGFYSVMWGKAKERKKAEYYNALVNGSSSNSTSQHTPLLHSNAEERLTF